LAVPNVWQHSAAPKQRRRQGLMNFTNMAP
jgi:hypothetical protein